MIRKDWPLIGGIVMRGNSKAEDDVITEVMLQGPAR